MTVNWTYIRDVGALRFFLRTLVRQFAKRVLRRDLRLRLPTGLVMDLPRASRAASEIFVTGCALDWGSEGLLLDHLDPEGCFLDVGANIGYYALLAAPRVRTVYAFEPDPRNWPALERNARRAGNVVVVRKALSREAGEMRLDVGGDPALSRLVADGEAAGAAITVEVTTLDRVLGHGLPCAVTAIKIDAEGHDLAVLEGGIGLLRAHAPLVLAEFAGGAGAANDADALFRLAGDIGYRVYAFVRQAGRPRFRLRRLQRETVGKLPIKMLFLVPPRLAAAFAARAGCGPGAGGEALAT